MREDKDPIQLSLSEAEYAARMYRDLSHEPATAVPRDAANPEGLWKVVDANNDEVTRLAVTPSR
ncbi:hypothetical protein AB0D97_13925 [Streptomyces roseus]|uniref:hypothetical protein n=1 Tax=Streptomyces roseus TaxID=66430 RepID=UPI00340DB2FD